MKRNILTTLMRSAAIAAFSLAPGMACTYAATSAAIGAAGGNVAIQVATQPGCGWRAVESGSVAIIRSGSQGIGSGSMTLYFGPNSGKTARTALVKGYTARGQAAFESSITQQAALPCSYSAASPVVGPGGGTVAMQVSTQPGCVWQAIEVSPFVSIRSARLVSGSGYLALYVLPNATRAARTALVRGVGGPYSQTVFQSSVTQYGR